MFLSRIIKYASTKELKAFFAFAESLPTSATLLCTGAGLNPLVRSMTAASANRGGGSSMGPFDQVFQFCHFTFGWVHLCASQQPLLPLVFIVLATGFFLLARLLTSSKQNESLNPLLTFLIICLYPVLLLQQQSLRCRMVPIILLNIQDEIAMIN